MAPALRQESSGHSSWMAPRRSTWQSLACKDMGCCIILCLLTSCSCQPLWPSSYQAWGPDGFILAVPDLCTLLKKRDTKLEAQFGIWRLDSEPKKQDSGRAKIFELDAKSKDLRYVWDRDSLSWHCRRAKLRICPCSHRACQWRFSELTHPWRGRGDIF